MYFGVSHASRPKRAERSLILKILLYLCLHPLKQNDQIRHGITYGEGRVFRWSVTSLHLHNASHGLSATAEFLVLGYGSLWLLYILITILSFSVSVCDGFYGQFMPETNL